MNFKISKDDYILVILVLIIIVFYVGATIYIIYFGVKPLVEQYNFEVENYTFEKAKLNAKLIDTHLSYTYRGTPVYYLIYEFPDGTIRDYRIYSEEYYQVMKEN